MLFLATLYVLPMLELYRCEVFTAFCFLEDKISSTCWTVLFSWWEFGQILLQRSFVFERQRPCRFHWSWGIEVERRGNQEAFDLRSFLFLWNMGVKFWQCSWPLCVPRFDLCYYICYVFEVEISNWIQCNARQDMIENLCLLIHLKFVYVFWVGYAALDGGRMLWKVCDDMFPVIWHLKSYWTENIRHLSSRATHRINYYSEIILECITITGSMNHDAVKIRQGFEGIHNKYESCLTEPSLHRNSVKFSQSYMTRYRTKY